MGKLVESARRQPTTITPEQASPGAALAACQLGGAPEAKRSRRAHHSARPTGGNFQARKRRARRRWSESG
eukprot:4080938-Pyramimonas_sp.AAC.1